MTNYYTTKKKTYGEQTKRELLERMKHFPYIKKEREKVSFIRFLREPLKKDKGRNFSFFVKFIIRNIEDESEKTRNEIIRMTDWLISSFPVSKEERNICKLINYLLFLMEKHYCEKYETCKYIDQLPPSVYKSLEILINKTLFSRKRIRTAYKNYLKDKEIYKKLDCAWKRVGCGKESCPVCGTSKRNLVYLHQSALFRSFQEENLSKVKSPPPAEKFALYLKVKEWCDDVFDVAEESEHYGDFWIFTSSGADLFWYSEVLSSKCYHQLCNRFYINQGCKDVDYEYTQYILKECVKILGKSLEEIVSIYPVRDFQEKAKEQRKRISNGVYPEQDDELHDLSFRLSFLKNELDNI